MMRHFTLLVVTVLAAFLLIISACGSNDSSDSSGAAPADDDTDITDDTQSDDADDSGDDTTDDDTTDPYAGLAPSGLMIDEILGIASHMTTGPEDDRARVFELEQSAAAGVHYSRRGFYWSSIEPENDVWNFDGYDVMVGLIRDAGISPVALLTRRTPWAAPGDSPSEIDPAYFEDFAATVSARYADDIDLYEIWNEENSGMFWSPEPDPEHYGLLLKAAYTAIHENDDNAQVILGGLSGFDPNLLDPRGIWNFIARLAEAHPDICDYLDGAAIHPYSFLQQPGPEFSLDLGIYSYPDIRGAIEEARGLLTGIGCGEIPIHLTEMGWPDFLIGTDRQGAYAARAILLASSAGAASCMWYTFYDEGPPSEAPIEDYFGLYLIHDGVTDPDPKPSYLAFRGVHLMAGNARYAGDLGAALTWDAQNYALAYATDDGAWTIALWRYGPRFYEEVGVEVPLHPAASGTWTLYDQAGAEISSGDATEGKVATTVSGDLRYLRFNIGS